MNLLLKWCLIVVFLCCQQMANAQTVLFDGKPTDAEQWGVWTLSNGSLKLRSGRPKLALNVWSPTSEGNQLSDGVASADVVLGRRRHVTLMGRGTLGSDGRALNGYGVTIKGRQLTLHRWDKGLGRPLMPSVRISGRLPSKVTLRLSLVGSQLVGSIHSGITGKALASITAIDSKWTTGRIMFRSSSNDKSSVLKRMYLKRAKRGTLDRNLFIGNAVEAGRNGLWTLLDQGLVLATPTSAGPNVWMPAERANSIDDGVLTARVSIGRRPDFSLMARAWLKGRNLSGYGLSFERNKVLLYRWDNGKARPISTSITLLDVPKSLVLELIMVSDQITGVVRHGETFQPLAVLTAWDAKYKYGASAFRAHSSQDEDTRFLSLSQHNGVSLDTKAIDIYGTEIFAQFDHLPKTVSWPVERVGTENGKPTVLLPNRDWLRALEARGGRIISATGRIPFFVRQPHKSDVLPKMTTQGFQLSSSLKNMDDVVHILEGFAEEFPDVARLHQLGMSTSGQPIYAMQVSRDPDLNSTEPAVIFDGGHHGNELMTIDAVLDVLQQILYGQRAQDPDIERYVSELDLWFVPMLNPDGNICMWRLDERAGRKNCMDIDGDGFGDPGAGTDLNRNYPFAWGALGEKGSSSWRGSPMYRGAFPASEPETQAYMNLAKRLVPAAVLSQHNYGNMLLSPYTTDRVRQSKPDIPWVIAESLIVNLGDAPFIERTMPVKRKMYRVDGTSQDWLFHEFGSMAFIVEGPTDNLRDSESRQRVLDYLRPISFRLLERVVNGPRISGVVRSQDSTLVDAHVYIEEWKTFQNERWSTRASGYFDRMLHRNGDFTLVVEASGFKAWRKRIKVSGPVKLDIVLEPL